jgi:hypothetical protein
MGGIIFRSGAQAPPVSSGGRVASGSDAAKKVNPATTSVANAPSLLLTLTSVVLWPLEQGD